MRSVFRKGFIHMNSHRYTLERCFKHAKLITNIYVIQSDSFKPVVPKVRPGGLLSCML